MRDESENKRNKTSKKSTVVKFPCGHVFHYGCAQEWLLHNSSCPTCRQEVGRVVRMRYVPEAARASAARSNNNKTTFSKLLTSDRGGDGDGDADGDNFDLNEAVEEAWKSLVNAVDAEKEAGIL